MSVNAPTESFWEFLKVGRLYGGKLETAQAGHGLGD